MGADQILGRSGVELPGLLDGGTERLDLTQHAGQARLLLEAHLRGPRRLGPAHEAVPAPEITLERDDPCPWRQQRLEARSLVALDKAGEGQSGRQLGRPAHQSPKGSDAGRPWRFPGLAATPEPRGAEIHGSFEIIAQGRRQGRFDPGRNRDQIEGRGVWGHRGRCGGAGQAPGLGDQPGQAVLGGTSLVPGLAFFAGANGQGFLGDVEHFARFAQPVLGPGQRLQRRRSRRIG